MKRGTFNLAHKNILKIILLFFLFNILSCNNGIRKDRDNISLTNVGYKKFILDSITTNTNINFRLNKINDKEYLSFFNRENFSIYIYNYKSGKLLRKIKIHRNGLNAITIPFYSIEYYIHTLDSIFISTIKNYYLLNSKGAILKKITPVIESKYIKVKKPIFDESTSYKRGILSFKIDVDLPDKNSLSYLRRSYDFDKEIVVGDFVNENILVHNYNDVLDYKLLDLQRRGSYDKIFKYFVKLSPLRKAILFLNN